MGAASSTPGSATDGLAAHGLQLLEELSLRSPAGTPIPVAGSAAKVLAFVALHDGPVGRRTVAATLWPDSSDERAGASLRSALWRLNMAPAATVESLGGRLRMAPGLAVDLHQLQALARDLPHASLPSSPAVLIDAFGTDLLPSWDEEWVALRREQWRLVRLHALELLADRLRRTGKWGDAAHAGLTAVRADPLRETAHRVLIEIYLDEGNRCDAVRQFQRYAEALDSELGLAPSPALAALLHGQTTAETFTGP